MTNPVGRPTVVTPEIITKLEHAFALGCSDIEACLYADIAPATLYNYQNANPTFVERKAELKETPILLARTSVIDGMKKNPELALRFLERRKKDEFAPRQETHHSGNIGLREILNEISGNTADLNDK